jgi:hypothetical protein
VLLLLVKVIIVGVRIVTRLSNATISTNRTAMTDYECGYVFFFHLVSLPNPRIIKEMMRTINFGIYRGDTNEQL